MVRQRRDQVSPEAVGLPLVGRRRASGLRREELAGLAGISTDYLTRLEQGRATAPSAQVVEAVARALRVTDAERELLFRLAGHAAPGRHLVPSRITGSVQRLLDRLAGTPVAVYDAANTLIVANAPYDALMGPTTTWRGIERNALWRYLVGPGSRAILDTTERANLEAQLVADLRLTVSRYPDDPALGLLVQNLAAASPRFGQLWEASDVGLRQEPARHKTINHPLVGPIAVDCDTLVVAGDELRIMVYTAQPGTADADRLALALVLGTQTLV